MVSNSANRLTDSLKSFRLIVVLKIPVSIMYRRAMSPTDINLDQEYSPSMNSHRFRDAKRPHEVVIENFITRGKSGNAHTHLTDQFNCLIVCVFFY